MSLVSSCLQTQGDGKVRVQIAQRAEHREHDPPLGVIGCRFPFTQ